MSTEPVASSVPNDVPRGELVKALSFDLEDTMPPDRQRRPQIEQLGSHADGRGHKQPARHLLLCT